MAFFQRNLPYIVVAVLVLFLILGAVGFIRTQESVPQRDFVMLVGEAGGGYEMLARQYQQLFKTRAVDLAIRPTASVEETLRLLDAGEASIAFIPGYLTEAWS